MTTIKILIGYDEREAIAYHVCTNSLIRHSSLPLSITPLALSNLNGYIESHGDGSNKFIYSRFLTPYLMNYQGWAIFIDGDMVILEDIAKLWNLRNDKYAVMCVHHSYKTKKTIKYLGAKNEDYPRKNWSSVVLWNCAHPSNKLITPEYVKNSNGSILHRFQWLSDDEIGEIPIEWNWLPDEFGPNPNAKLLHYTLGTPCFHEFAKTPMSEYWHSENLLTNFAEQIKGY